MAVPAPYAFAVNRVTISGDCFNGTEEWTTGFYIGSETADASDPVGQAQVVATAWNFFWNGTNSFFPTVYSTREVKVAQIKADGLTDLDRVDYYTFPTAIFGTGALKFPAQIAMAATLTSDIQRGLASKGRMFLPQITFGIDSATGKQTSGSMTTVANNVKTFLDSVNAGLATNSIILASHGHAIKNAAGEITGYTGAVNANVTGCRVGDVMDTQRRRRDSLQEIYTSRVLAP